MNPSRTPFNRRPKRRPRFSRRAYRPLGPIASLESLEPRWVLAGTPLLIDINPQGSSAPADFAQVGDFVYFAADDGVSGRELWRTDGTQAGTSLVKDITAGAESSYPQQLVAFDGALYFTADDAVNGEELWRSDGTEAGTVMVRDINPGEGYQYPYGYGILRSIPRDLTVFDGRLYFSAEDAVNGKELWSSDGTQAGTTLVSNINPNTFTDEFGTYPSSSSPADLVSLNGRLFFTADDGATGRELWTTDGTAAGTVLVKDIFTGTYEYDAGDDRPNASNPIELTGIDGELFFIARDEAHGTELWKSDGTAAGTVLVRDINPGESDGLYYDHVLTAVGSLLMFAADDGVHGAELWRSDGTTAGTELVRDVRPGDVSGTSLDELVDVGGSLFFAANDGVTGTELWKSDGTEAGTVLVSNLDNSSGSSSPQNLTAVNDLAFFSATTLTSGQELWESDGTLVGTRQVADLADGTAGSSPQELFDFGGLLLFSADDIADSRELWVVDSAAVDASFEARLSIFVDSQQFVIPANIGVAAGGELLSQVQTADNFGTLRIDAIAGEPIAPVTVGDFFTTWRTNAGQAGNNPDAILSQDQLLDNFVDAENTVQMFVNGQVSRDFEDYVIQEDDQIVLVYGDNPVLSLNTNFGPIVLELFEGAAPGTVNNFLNYVNRGDYIDSIFHRSDPDFVIQGGGFTTASLKFTDVSQFTPLVTDPPIQNEPGMSNLRRTVAMAKTSDPNSATSQFFVNLSDANTILDPVSAGAFTVFAQVLDMTTVDLIESFPINTANPSPFDELPVTVDDELTVVQEIVGQGDIAGRKFFDANGNGVLDAGEQGVEGVTVYVDANQNATFDAGEVSATTDSDGLYRLQIEPGDYTLRAELSPGRVSVLPASESYSVTVQIGRQAEGSFDFAETLISAPATLDLSPATDSGAADDDDVTNFNNSSAATALQFQLTGLLDNAAVRVYSDGALIGVATAVGGLATVTTDAATILSDGVHALTATQTIAGTESDPTPVLSLTIDTLAPAALTNSAPNTAQVGQLYEFDADSPDEGLASNVYSLEGAPAGMTIDASSGQIAWTPTTEQLLPQTITIRLADAAGNSVAETVNITVLGVIPAFPDNYAAVEDTTLTIDRTAGVLANDGDGATGTLSATVVDAPSHGSVTLNADGAFVYTPDPNYFGADAFTYVATDGVDDTNVAFVSIDVAGVNDAPLGVADAYAATEDETLSITAAQGVLANDTDADGNPLTAALVNPAANGAVTLNGDGSFSYTPNANFSGPDSFDYTVSDGTLTSDPITVALTVAAVDDPPTTLPDEYTVNEDDVLTVDAITGVLANDSDPDSTTLTAAIAAQPLRGSVVLGANGSFTYTPDAHFFGTDSFAYAVSDGVSTSSPTEVTITVNSQPDPPSAVNDVEDARSDGSTEVFDVLANDTAEPDTGQTLSIASVTQGTAGGAVAIVGNVIEYTAPLGFEGQDTFTYTVEDNDGLTDSATVTVNVIESGSGVISGFVFLDADNDGVRAAAELGVPGVLITLTGADNFGEAVELTALTHNNGSYQFTELVSGTYALRQSQPAATIDGLDTTSVTGAIAGEDEFTNLVLGSGQTLSENNFAEIRLKPEYMSIVWFFASATEQQDVFREMVAKGEESVGNSSLATAIRDGATDLPEGLNTAPTSVADAYTIGQGGTLTVTAADGVLANDRDAENDPLTATLITPPTDGDVNFNDDGSFTYTPDAAFIGSDVFTYRAFDGVANSADATVTITVVDQANTFSIRENSISGSFVGTITPPPALGETLVFEVQDPNVPAELKLLPDDHFDGDTAGALTLIEYVDFQCPTCATYHPVIQDLEDEFADELLVVRRHLPLTTVHLNAYAAARAAEAAGRQDMFNEMGDLLFENLTEWQFADDPQPFFEDYALELGLDFIQFLDDVEDPTIDDRINRDIASAEALGANSTPTFFLDGRDIDLPAVDGFDEVIQAELDDFDQPFVVDRTTGDIFVAAEGLNFESTNTFSFTVDIRNLDADAEPVTVVVNLEDVNEFPTPQSDSYEVDGGQTLTVSAAEGVLANDTDEDGDALTAEVVIPPANGQVALNSDGSFTYTPDATFLGTDTFTYRASDGELTAAPETVTILVNSVNTAPTTDPDSYVVDEDMQLTINAVLGVLGNDSDPENDALTAQLVDGASNGTLTLNADGSFVYVPNANFNGEDAFTYRANDGELFSQPGAVSITVRPVNDVPVAAGESYTVVEDEELSVAAADGLLVNDSDADGQTLTAVLITLPTHGSLSLLGDGSFTYRPDADFDGSDSFFYAASDGVAASQSTEVMITVTPGNDNLPASVNDAYAVAPNNVLNIDAADGVLSNDDDADGHALTASLVVGPANGFVALSVDGSFIYTPDADFHGFDEFTYVANDGFDDGNVASVTIAVNRNPAAVNDEFVTNEDEPLDVVVDAGILQNDTDDDADVLTTVLITDVSNGELTLDDDGSFRYVPAADFNGEDSFVYAAFDGFGDSSPAVVTITVNPANDAPTSADDLFSVAVDGTLTVAATLGVLANDVDLEDDVLEVELVGAPSQGDVVLSPDGSFTYTPNAGFHGTDTFTYTATDGVAIGNLATVTIQVNSLAAVVADAFEVDEDAVLEVPVVLGVLSNDSDVDADPLTAALLTEPQNGTLAFAADGSFVYTPNANFAGGDAFTYVANDGFGDSAPATVTVTVNAVNDPPLGVPDEYSVVVDGTLDVDAANGVLSNDVDVDGDPLMITLVDDVANGVLTLNADGSFSYVPAVGFHGDDSFSYSLTDGQTDLAVVPVTLHVNSAPTVSAAEYQSGEDQPLSLDAAAGVLASAADADGDALAAVLLQTTSNGSLILAADGGFTYLPDADFSGTDSFTFVARDGFEDSAPTEITIVVNPANDAPRGTSDAYTVAVDGELTVEAIDGVLSNDVDPDGDAFTAVIAQSPINGVVTLNADGSFAYTPSAGFHGADQFTYRIDDGAASSADVIVTIDVNTAPASLEDAYSLSEDETRVVSAAEGVLLNDSDADGDAVTATLTSAPVNGTLVFNPDGSFEYTPLPDFVGTDTFTYVAEDGFSSTVETTVTLTVSPVNDAPQAADDAYLVPVDGSLSLDSLAGVLANDVDADGDALTAVLVDGPTNGALTLNSNGSFDYTPNGGYQGPDSFTYMANDGAADSTTATVNIEVNSRPTAVGELYEAVEDQVLVVDAAAGVSANDSDADGDAFSLRLVQSTFNGDLTLNADGSFTYTPDENFDGTDAFSYVLADAFGDSETATALITFIPVNDAPEAIDDLYVAPVDGTLTVAAGEGVLINDIDIDGDALTATLATEVSSGTLQLNEDGSFEYSPTSGFHGADTFSYVASDSVEISAAASVTLIVNTAPQATANAYSVAEDGQLSVDAANGVLSNVVDSDGDALTASLSSDAAHGTLVLNADGSFEYTPDADFAGPDAFRFRVNDGFVDSAEITATITVDAVNDPPATASDEYATDEDVFLFVPASLGLLANDSDIDGGNLTAALATGPANGSLILGPDGAFSYSPNLNFHGVDSFTYTVSDGSDVSDATTVTINVAAVNDPPVAAPDAFAVNEDTTLTTDFVSGVLRGDLDADGDPLTVVLVSDVEHGALTLNADGSFDYTPSLNFTGLDTFSYQASDGDLLSAVTAVSISVTPVNDAPQAFGDAYTTNEDVELVVDAATGVLANDTDIDGDTLFAVVVETPAHGTLTLNANGSFSYSPDAEFSGDDQFIYLARDDFANSTNATVTITVNGVADAPVAQADAFTVGEDAELNIDSASGVLANDADPEGDSLTAVLVQTTSHGSLTLNANGSFSYAPASNFHGSDTFTYQANDGVNNSETTTVTITVNPANDAPTAVDDAYFVDEDATLSIAENLGVRANDADVDGDSLTVALAQDVSNGTLTLDPTGSFSYTPNANFVGADSFTYTVDDGVETSAAATVNITVKPVNDVPVAAADSYEIAQDAVLSVNASAGVLANDSDLEDDALSALIVTTVAHGTLSLDNDGAFTYTPEVGFFGADSFTYEASDGAALSETTTVNLNVLEANTFNVSEGAAAETLVGQVVADPSLGQPRIFEFVDAALPAQLQLAADDHLAGDAAAPVVLIEYLDFQCPACRSFHPIVSQLEDDFAGELLVVRRHLPLTSIHPNAFVAARAAEAAGRQGAFEAMGDLLFANQPDWANESDPTSFFETYASSLGLDLDQFRTDVADSTVDDRINRDFNAADELGAPGTPTFYVNGQQIASPSSLEAFATVIETELAAVDDVFALDRLTGELFVRDSSALDFNTNPSFTLSVNVTDLSGATETSAVTVNVVEQPAGEPDPLLFALDNALADETDWLAAN